MYNAVENERDQVTVMWRAIAMCGERVSNQSDAE